MEKKPTRKRPLGSGRAPIPGLKPTIIQLTDADRAWLRSRGEIGATIRALIAEKRASEG